MKVGTDSVLLSAWVKTENPKTILDIGSGTGLISLIMAQKFENADIYSIEIDKETAEECASNFNDSKWINRLFSIHQSFLDFNFDNSFDLIISNPPYFSEKTKPKSKKRELARHNDSLSLDLLIRKSEKLLNKDGIISLVIPYSEIVKLKNVIKKFNLFIGRICFVKGVKDSYIKRILVEISKNEVDIIEESLVIENSRHEYTREYKELCKDLYLNF